MHSSIRALLYLLLLPCHPQWKKEYSKTKTQQNSKQIFPGLMVNIFFPLSTEAEETVQYWVLKWFSSTYFKPSLVMSYQVYYKLSSIINPDRRGVMGRRIYWTLFPRNAGRRRRTWMVYSSSRSPTNYGPNPRSIQWPCYQRWLFSGRSCGKKLFFIFLKPSSSFP